MSLLQNVTLYHDLLDIIRLYHEHEHYVFEIIHIHTQECKNVKGVAQFPHVVGLLHGTSGEQSVKQATGCASRYLNACRKGSCVLLVQPSVILRL